MQKAVSGEPHVLVKGVSVSADIASVQLNPTTGTVEHMNKEGSASRQKAKESRDKDNKGGGYGASGGLEDSETKKKFNPFATIRDNIIEKVQ